MKWLLKIFIIVAIYLIFRLIGDDFITGWLGGLISLLSMILIDEIWEDE